MDRADSDFVFDAHCDTAMRFKDNSDIDLGERLSDGQVDLPRMLEAGYGAQVFACWVDPDLSSDKWNSCTLDMIRRLREQIEKNSDQAAIAKSGSDIRRIAGEGKVAAVVGVEGGHAIGSNMESLLQLYRNDVRCITITWNNTNEIADSCEGGPKWGGLSSFGREVIHEMNKAGMVIDCSHSSDDTFFDILKESSNPVLISHSCMRAICDVPRNVTDEMLEALGENGGVIGINYFPAFLEQECSERIMAQWGEYKEERSRLAAEYGGDVARVDAEILPAYMKRLESIPLPGISVVVDHIEHAAAVIGTGHVGLGSDFDGTPVMPVGLGDVSKVPMIDAELGKRGYSKEERGAIMGGNLLRLFDKVCK